METVIKAVAICGVVAGAIWMLSSCNDKIDVRKDYDFTLSTWYLQKTIEQDEPVEIRFTLDKAGNYDGAEYSVGYIQMEGKGAVYDEAGTLLVNREMHALDDMANVDHSHPFKDVFTLFYRSVSDKKSELKFIVMDNFGQQTDITVNFEIEK
ncbi:MAG: DUF3872 domain-containing protein [Alistipes indistinctus]|uniref:TraQ conjugal transfer family protein n=1 Tax=Alistipes indistinctus TaxID=626932 RepID=UPI00241EBAC0|nr:TraQ conjugal transfer family protein [Alistipes indistinctus]MBD9133610.1 DUF3872 domain-containing protein [Alistipes indistinctus]